MLIKRPDIDEFLDIAKLDREAWQDNNQHKFIPDGEHVWRIWLEHAIVFCAKQDELIGVILAFPTTNNSYCIHKVFVKSGFRRNGVGSSLFMALIEEVDMLNIHTFLTVDPENKSAIALYEKWGFKNRLLIKGYYREDEDRYVLSRYPKKNA